MLYLAFQRAGALYTQIQPTFSPSPPNPRLLYIISLHFLLRFLDSSLIFGLWGGLLFSCELSYAFKQIFLIFYLEFLDSFTWGRIFRLSCLEHCQKRKSLSFSPPWIISVHLLLSFSVPAFKKCPY